MDVVEDAGLRDGLGVRHPGPKLPPEAEVVATHVRCTAGQLPAGTDIGTALARFVADAGAVGGMVELSGGVVDPLRFVIPALKDDGTKLSYSATHEVRDAVPDCIVCTIGTRDGAPFAHCHGVWHAADGTLSMGHMLFQESMILEPVDIVAHLSTDASFDVRADRETEFSVFSAQRTGETATASNAAFVRLRPNTDPVAELAGAAASVGLSSARIHGIGSFVDLRLADAPDYVSPAVEVMVLDGRLVDGAVVDLVLAGVGCDGAVVRGRAAPLRNRTCVTAEFLLVDNGG